MRGFLVFHDIDKVLDRFLGVLAGKIPDFAYDFRAAAGINSCGRPTRFRDTLLPGYVGVYLDRGSMSDVMILMRAFFCDRP